MKTTAILTPRIEGVEVNMQVAIEAIVEAFRAKNSLLWRGNGTTDMMEEVTNLFMAKIKGTLTKGSLSDGAGNAGILNGRGIHHALPWEEVAKADTVVVWGRNIDVNDTDIMASLEGKKIVVIDPIKTPIAKRADCHLQIQPRTDYYVGLMLSRFIFMEDSEQTEWMDEFAPEYEEYYDFTREHRIKPILNYIGTDLGEMGTVLEYLRNQKVVFLVGTGVQKYSTGSSVLHVIDSLATILGLFGKEGCGVSYIGDAKAGVKNPFEVKTPRVSKVTTPFEKFETVLIQGGNPAESMPDSSTVKEALESVENLIYFGLYENETSKRAKIVIPAQTPTGGISAYQLTQKLFEAFGFEGLETEAYYREQCAMTSAQSLPYTEGFGEEGDEPFTFIEEYDDDFINTKRFTKYRKTSQNKKIDESYWLLSVKAKRALERERLVQIHPSLGYQEGESVRLISEYGEVVLQIKHNEDIRPDCVLVNHNTIGINHLTPSIVSDEGENACFQEVKITIEKI